MTNLSDDHIIRDKLIQYLKRIGQVNPEWNADQLLKIDGGFSERFEFLDPLIPTEFKKDILISGCAVGSELIAAVRFQYKNVIGTEVTEEYVKLTEERIKDYPNLKAVLYDGSTLPFEDCSFSTVYSGHIIEHTPEPFEYFKEHMRVLVPGGFFFLEFPNRYHLKELHTGEFSLEYLPKFLRDFIIEKIILKSKLLSAETRHNYLAIMETLHPISIQMIKIFYKNLFNYPAIVIGKQKPYPGFSRLLLRKPMPNE